MIHVLADVSIEDLPRFVGVFATRGAELRGKHGSRRSQVFRVRDEGQRLIVLFEWESKEAFEDFLADASTREAMKASGTTAPPTFTLLEKVGEFPS